ncbi:MAG: glycosyltransferase [Sulfurovaceae bacterium]|nr:glycosyltransferase [Sulfurovaceae bacterium]
MLKENNMDAKIDLLHLITGLGVGGAERVVLDLSRNSNKERYQTSVISMSKQHEMLEMFKKENVDVNILNMNSSITDLFKIVGAVSRHVKKQNIQLIHAHMTDAMVVSVMVKMLNPKLKLVFTSHNITFGSKIRTLSVKLLKSFRDRDILFSQDQLSSIYKKNYEMIPNGIDINRYKLNLKKNEKFTFITVGRLEKQKNHIKLLESAVALRDKKLDFQILIVGEGKDPIQKKRVEDFIVTHQLENHVHLLGVRFDIPELISKADCFVLSSAWEGLPIVLLEAAASQIPIVSTPVGSIPSLIDERCGYLADENFTEAMEEVMMNYSSAKEKAVCLYDKVVANYSIESIVQKHEKIYEELV